MVENIEKVLERGEHIDILVDKSDGLETESLRFKKQSGRLRNTMWWQDKKMCGILTAILVIILIIIIAEATK